MEKLNEISGSRSRALDPARVGSLAILRAGRLLRLPAASTAVQGVSQPDGRFWDDRFIAIWSMVNVTSRALHALVSKLPEKT